MARTRDELTTAKKKLDTVVQVIHSSLKFEKKIMFKERLSEIMVLLTYFPITVAGWFRKGL